MYILSAQQIRDWDEYTIRNEPVSSIDLMERAARACYEWIINNGYESKTFHVFCGKGNNGGDGLAIARMLHQRGAKVEVHVLEFGHKGTDDFQTNLTRIHDIDANIRFIPSATLLPELKKAEIIIDALLGSGLNRPVEGLTELLIKHLNASGNEIISIDLPSGLPADSASGNHTVVHASHTLTFQSVKKSFLAPENEDYLGLVHVLDIGLSKSYLAQISSTDLLIDSEWAGKVLKKRKSFAHKGSFGHALLIAGSYGKVGAAVLAGKACLRTGAGLTTIHAPSCAYGILQTALPEAMTMVDKNPHRITEVHFSEMKFSVAGIGPGIGTDPETVGMLEKFLKGFEGNTILDADALNIIAANPRLSSSLKPGTVLSPHPREFERLFGKTKDSFERLELGKQQAVKRQLVIILKGKHSAVFLPNGETWFNTSGNSGMATGGTGDVLTGIITALLARHYEPADAARLGVYVHGLAADLAVAEASEESLIAGDIPESLGKAFTSLRQLPA